MAAKNNEISDSVPIPPNCVRPRMLATGVSISRRPAFAILPEEKTKSPRATSNTAGCDVPPSGKFLQRHAGAARQVKDHTVIKANADPAIGRGLDDIALENRIADFDFEKESLRAA